MSWYVSFFYLFHIAYRSPESLNRNITLTFLGLVAVLLLVVVVVGSVLDVFLGV